MKKVKYKRNNDTFLLGGLILVFMFCFLFYWKISPIMPYDTDDWYYMGYFRYPVPLWGDWNPTRILPEVMMPNVSIAAAYTLYPLTGDYIESMVIMYAFLMAVILTILCSELYKLFYSINNSRGISIGMTLLWVLLHFSLMVKTDRDNTWLWSSITAACYFYYTMPAIINEIIIVYLLRKRNDISKKFWIVLIVLGYFGIFSNLFQAIILGAYAGMEVMFSFVDLLMQNRNNYKIIKKGEVINKPQKLNKKKRFGHILNTKILKQNAYNIYLITLFLISIYFEMYGGRASGFDGFDFKGSITKLIETIAAYNELAICSVVLVLALSIFSFTKTRYKRSVLFDSLKLFLSVFPLVIFLLLVSSKAGSWYIGRADVQLVIIFFPLLSVLYFLSKSMRSIEKKSSGTEKNVFDIDNSTKLIFSCLLIAILCNVAVLVPYNKKFYKPSNISSFEPEVCKRIDEDIVSQILAAKEQGISSMELHVPKFSTEDNWPMATYSGGYQSRFPYTLWRHGLIESGVYVEVVPDENKNIEFGIN